jgi:hypothetical protein
LTEALARISGGFGCAVAQIRKQADKTARKRRASKKAGKQGQKFIAARTTCRHIGNL